MNTSPVPQLAAGIAAIALAVATACGGDDNADQATAATTTSESSATTEVTISPTQTSPATTHGSAAETSEPTTSAAVATTSPVDDGWREDAAAVCASYFAATPDLPTPATATIAEVVAALRELWDRPPSIKSVDLPEDLRGHIDAIVRQADALLTDAELAGSAGDIDAATTALDHQSSLPGHIAGLLTVAGVECGGDPERAANAVLNVPVPGGVNQVATGFGSVWANVNSPWSTSIHRIDPASGELLATIDLGATPFKAQPADGRMIVRTADTYTAIDPATNTVVATLPKSAVGAAANRNWAVDGAMWICDGQRLHRYDPATFTATATVIEIGIDCGQVYATTDLVVAWTYNEDPGESGTSAAVFVDPQANEVLATTALPIDATVPIILDHAVFFPAQSVVPDNAGNAVVDRATWALTATPDYGRTIGHSQMAYDGRSIYLIADDADVLVIDPDTYELTDVIQPLAGIGKLNALATGPGALWVATGSAGILQRFDVQ